MTSLVTSRRRRRHEVAEDAENLDDGIHCDEEGRRHKAVGDGHEEKRGKEQDHRHDSEVDATRLVIDGHVTGSSVSDCNLQKKNNNNQGPSVLPSG